ncbi:MAG TPA: prepilin-type N-terminal cleavage/methylation domain-containing protein [Opitutales bacterium]|nr:prepilin-type N-terminal cleavage/methylation domain-containing protein [Opitutales bacterium]
MIAFKKSSLKQAFTLIELLTVIAIIGILAAILIPVVGQAREQAKVAQCAIHLRDLGSAVLLYANDHNDFVPPHIVDYASDPSNTSEWGVAVGPERHGVIGLLLAPEKGGARIPGWSGDYLDSPHPLICPATREELYNDPAYKRPDEINERNPIRRSGYMWIYRTARNRDNTKVTVENLNRPYVFDFPAPGTSTLSPVFTFNPHQNRVNVLHIGGHVTSFSIQELFTVPPDAHGNYLFDYFTFRQNGIRP